MANRRFLARPTTLALAAACCAGAHAQAVTADGAQTVTITGRSGANAPAVSGFGSDLLARTPLAASVVGSDQLANLGAGALSILTRTDASVSDSYDAPGYWSMIAIRGYALDNRFNYRRDGLPINAETVLPLDNKERLEVLKGLSGLQAGTSAPGGLVNLVVKRPLAQPLRSATLGFTQGGALLGAADVSQRLGAGDAFGLRVNAAYEHLDTATDNTRGHRQLAAVAGDWRLAGGALLEAEWEWSHQSQPSVPGLSMLGTRVPGANEIAPTRNLNDQPWSLPVVFGASTASLRYTQPLGEGWRLQVHALEQRLKTDDRLAFPLGCSAANDYRRYCVDGSFDYYAFQSDNERRTSRAVQAQVEGQLATGAVQHTLATGLLVSRYRAELQPRVDDGTVVGTGNVFGTAAPIARLPALGTTANTNRQERSTELFLRDKVSLGDWGLWLGLRHSRIERDSVRTNGTQATQSSQSFTTPWLAATWQLMPAWMAYGSWGEGVESEVTPNRSYYTNRGETLPALKSRQMEIGLKHAGASVDATLALFDIRRPATADLLASAGAQTNGYCNDPDDCTRVIDGRNRHRGLEASGTWRLAAWTLDGSAMWLHARREGAQAEAALNGLRPTNVPARTLRLNAAHVLAMLPGLTLSVGLVAESDRMVLPENDARIPGWSRLDLAARYVQRMSGSVIAIWRVGVDNVGDRQAWRESPYQYGHAYLFPLAPRTWRGSVQLQF